MRIRLFRGPLDGEERELKDDSVTLVKFPVRVSGPYDMFSCDARYRFAVYRRQHTNSPHFYFEGYRT